MGHAVAAGDATWAARLIERHADALILRSEEAGRTATRRPRRANISVIPALVEPLSARELEVLDLLAAGKANREIADELYVTLDTVKKHVTHIMGKLGVVNRTQAAARARSLGLLS